MNSSGNDLEKWLVEAINDNDLKKVQEYLDCGAFVDWRNSYGIFKAIDENNLELARVLVENKADLNFNRNENGDYPLTVAIDKGHLEIASFFIKNGADLDADDNIAIRTAARSDYFDLVKELVQHGADLNDKFDTMLRCATEISPELLDWCFENGGKPNNPAFLVNHCTESGRAECLAHLADKGFSMNEKEHNGEYPLYVAAIADRADNIEILLNKGVDPNDQKALLGAINNGHLEATKALVERGADPTANNDNALYQAITWGHDEITTYLIAEHKMPVREETRKWLKQENPDNLSIIHTKQLLDKRDLRERLEQKSQRPPTATKSKSMSLKI